MLHLAHCVPGVLSRIGASHWGVARAQQVLAGTAVGTRCLRCVESGVLHWQPESPGRGYKPATHLAHVEVRGEWKTKCTITRLQHGLHLYDTHAVQTLYDNHKSCPWYDYIHSAVLLTVCSQH